MSKFYNFIFCYASIFSLLLFNAVIMKQSAGQGIDEMITLIVHNVDDATLRNENTNALITGLLKNFGRESLGDGTLIRYVNYRDYVRGRHEMFIAASSLLEFVEAPVSLVKPTPKEKVSVYNLASIFFESVLRFPDKAHAFMFITNDVPAYPILEGDFELSFWDNLIDNRFSEDEVKLIIDRVDRGLVVLPVVIVYKPILPRKGQVPQLICMPDWTLINPEIPDDQLDPPLGKLRRLLLSLKASQRGLDLHDKRSGIIYSEKRENDESDKVKRITHPEKRKNGESDKVKRITHPEKRKNGESDKVKRITHPEKRKNDEQTLFSPTPVSDEENKLESSTISERGTIILFVCLGSGGVIIVLLLAAGLLWYHKSKPKPPSNKSLFSSASFFSEKFFTKDVVQSTPDHDDVFVPMDEDDFV